MSQIQKFYHLSRCSFRCYFNLVTYLAGIETDSSRWNSTFLFNLTIVYRACMVFWARRNYQGPYFTPTRA